MTVRAAESERRLGGLMVLRCKDHITQALLVQIAQAECYVAELYGTISPDPEHFSCVARHSHFRTQQQPVGNGSQRQGRMEEEVRISVLASNQVLDNFLKRWRVLGSELERTIRPLREVWKRVVHEIDLNTKAVSLGETADLIQCCRTARKPHEEPVDANVYSVTVSLANAGDSPFKMGESIASLYIAVVGVTHTVESNGEAPQPRSVEDVELLGEQYPIGGDERLHAEFDRMLHHTRQIGVQQRFTAIQPDLPESEVPSVIEQITNNMPRQLSPGHEIPAISATDAAQVAVCRNGDLQLSRRSPNELRDVQSQRLSGAFQPLVRIGKEAPDAAIMVEIGREQAPEARAKLHGHRGTRVKQPSASSGARPWLSNQTALCGQPSPTLAQRLRPSIVPRHTAEPHLHG
jgi:hypothetical protein